MTSGARLLAALAISVCVACSSGTVTPGSTSTQALTSAVPPASPAPSSAPTARGVTPIPVRPTATATVLPLLATPTPRPTAAVPTPTRPAPAVAAFVSGIYFRRPQLQTPGGTLTLSGGRVLARIEMPSGGFSIHADRLVFSDSMSTLFLVSADGATRALPVQGLFRLARPSLSPSGDRVAVQASETRDEQPENLDIFVVELNSGRWSKISHLPVNEESPAWFPASNRIAYSSFSPEQGVNLHIVDSETGLETSSIPDGGAISVAIS